MKGLKSLLLLLIAVIAVVLSFNYADAMRSVPALGGEVFALILPFLAIKKFEEE